MRRNPSVLSTPLPSRERHDEVVQAHEKEQGARRSTLQGNGAGVEDEQSGSQDVRVFLTDVLKGSEQLCGWRRSDDDNGFEKGPHEADSP